MTQDYAITDDFGRVTSFRGTKLIAETTDADHKPKWLDITIWRTEAGKYISMRETHYRVRHLHQTCTRTDDRDLMPAKPADTWPCPTCNPHGVLDGGYRQVSRTRLDVYATVQDLITGLARVNQQTGARYWPELSQAILADMSEQDPDIRAAWMVQEIS